MIEEAWRPLGIDTEEEVAEYDALHDGVPKWMRSSFWVWVRDALTVRRRYRDGSGPALMLDTDLAEHMCQTLKIPLPDLRSSKVSDTTGQWQLTTAITTLQKHDAPLQIADYLLAHGSHAGADDLGAILVRSKSAYQIGVRTGRPGLTRRVPLGVQVAADAAMARSGRAGTRLAKAWEELYGLTPNASEAYRLAILAVEDAAVPVVSPSNSRATLGTVLRQLEDQGDWRLPMEREHDSAPSSQVLISLMRMLWHGQHDRHGGQPSAPGNVSIDEAQVAVSVAVPLVQWFCAELIGRAPRTV
ncbi:hypothetical protein ABZ780_09640 [Micromonospora sp. NPDC047467]|uniref:hypothetical protein n=1 Tax=Micromonospora sp. NPDC047467 TaxID=3154814 RepID=UPI00340C4640